MKDGDSGILGCLGRLQLARRYAFTSLIQLGRSTSQASRYPSGILTGISPITPPLVVRSHRWACN